MESQPSSGENHRTTYAFKKKKQKQKQKQNKTNIKKKGYEYNQWIEILYNTQGIARGAIALISAMD